MTQREIIDAISALSQVAEANKGFLNGSESTQVMANKKIKELIPLINNEPKLKEVATSKPRNMKKYLTRG